MKDLMIFSLSSSVELAKKVADILGVEVSKSELIHFADGEIMTRALDSVRDKDVYLIQSTCAPAPERIMEVLIFVDSVKRAKAKSINLVLPYYGYSRQDRVAKFQEPVSSELLAKLFETSGVDSLYVLDIHASTTKNFFKIPVYEMSLISHFSLYIDKLIKRVSNDELVIVSPDHGGVNRAKLLAKHFPGAHLAILDKKREFDDEAKVVDIHGYVDGKTAIIIDDIIGTAGTMIAATDTLLKSGAKEVYAVATHGIFSRDGRKLVEDSRIKKMIVSDSVDVEPSEKVSVVSCDVTIATWILSTYNK